MSVFDGRPGLRWAVPLGAATLIGAGAIVAPLAATADAGVAPLSAQQILVDLQQPTTLTVSGTVHSHANLGLPDLSMLMDAGGTTSGPLSALMGDSTLRVWADGPTRQRAAMIEQAAETAVVRNDSTVWVWSSRDQTADRYTLPAQAQALDTIPSKLPPGVTLPSTPAEVAQMALKALEPSTQVTTTGVGRVAGRAVQELMLTPRDSHTLVANVALAMDAETHVPLAVRVYSTRTSDPALEVAFTSVDFGTPDSAHFVFTPPPGAKVTEHPAPGGAAGASNGSASSREPTTVGSGWSTVLVGKLPADALGKLAQTGSQDQSSGGAAGALALLDALPSVSGSWGTGKEFSGTLYSAIVTDDGRFAAGAVDSTTLEAALGSAATAR
jgi:outer membrane lipoprotein-sorting protein